MQIDLFDTKKLIDENNLKEVTDPMLFLKGSIPSPGGLISYEIFGNSIKDRMKTFAYINLHGHYLHPFIYKLLKRLNRNFEHIVHSTKKYRIEGGGIVEDEENGDTGIDFLYDNWEKLDFTKNESLIRGERIDVLKSYKKNVLFTDYWIVIPAYYRDVNLQNMGKGKLSHNEINDKYSSLIRSCAVNSASSSFDFVLAATRARIQEQLVDIYDFIKSKIEKKTGMIRRNLLGKSIDYGARCVISTNVFDYDRPEDMKIDIFHTGIPLSQCCSLFNPFMVAYVKNFFRQTFETSGGKLTSIDSKGNISVIEVDSPEMYFNDEFIKKQLDSFIRGRESRFDIVYIPVKTKEKLATMKFSLSEVRPSKSNPITLDRPCTWCDIFYQAAVEVTADKMVCVSRYPILDNFSIYPNKIHVMSTKKTMAAQIGDKVYAEYPIVDLELPKSKIPSQFIDTVILPNPYCAAMDADFDGDQVPVRGLFTQEANKEAYDIMMSKRNFLDTTGKNVRTSEKESIQTLYSLTKNP